jgi:hypothetical protein
MVLTNILLEEYMYITQDFLLTLSAFGVGGIGPGAALVGVEGVTGAGDPPNLNNPVTQLLEAPVI